eukprot:682034-Pyramimonas_sp.AAC.1
MSWKGPWRTSRAPCKRRAAGWWVISASCQLRLVGPLRLRMPLENYRPRPDRPDERTCSAPAGDATRKGFRQLFP